MLRLASNLLVGGGMRIVLAVLVAQLIACATDDPPVSAYPPGFGTAADPLPNTNGYSVQSQIVMSLRSAAVDGAIAQLEAFSLHGGATLLAATAGTASGQALDALPASLRSKLGGWIDVELDKQKLGTATPRHAIGDVATMAKTVVSQLMIESNLTIGPAGALHTLSDLNFRPVGLDVVVLIGGSTADKITQHPTAEVGGGGALAVGDERFALALGSHAWQGLNLAVEARYGNDLAIVNRLDCSAIGQSVAARCVSGACVGHASDIVAVCQQGMITLVDDLRDGLAPIVLDARLVAGTAKLVDANHDGVAEKIVGTWEAEIDVGAGATSMQIAFTSMD